MGLFDIFNKKSIPEKMEDYAKKGNIGKLQAAVDSSKPKETRLAALDALRLIKHRAAVDTLMEALRDEDRDIRYAATKSLFMNGTKDRTDHLLNFSEAAKAEGDTELADMLKEAALSAKERTPVIG